MKQKKIVLTQTSQHWYPPVIKLRDKANDIKHN